MFDSERADARALEQLEAILRDVAEELSTWRARALKARLRSETLRRQTRAFSLHALPPRGIEPDVAPLLRRSTTNRDENATRGSQPNSIRRTPRWTTFVPRWPHVT